jgi:hypothetical protein
MQGLPRDTEVLRGEGGILFTHWKTMHSTINLSWPQRLKAPIEPASSLGPIYNVHRLHINFFRGCRAR